MKEPFCYLVCRYINSCEWMIISNPIWQEFSSEGLAWKMMEQNIMLQYVEYENAGIVYRVVREGSWELENQVLEID